MPFTLTNNLPGDASLDVGNIPRGGTLEVEFLSEATVAAAEAGSISISPAVMPLNPVPLVSAISAYAGTTIVDPTSAALSRANDALIAARLTAVEATVSSLQKLVYSRLKLGD